ncbi:diguanylate cyclase [Mariprofundus micogutta]|uniref:diguanylate cyclase n=1 Tax=Mariprofundus micogutta TaxID=1921010 RepID=A0A1L8CNQ6_9PROT|nr:response regulator [Mariprofundus micogutta]GAV20537.1 diguanylate cyclase [Mariprofundus micogutta]
MQEKVLLVDDSLFICKTVHKHLGIHVDMEVDVAHNLEEAMQLVERDGQYYFVALLDLNLPDAPNGEIVDYISIHDIPFVVFSANESEDMKSMCELHPQMIDYVNKDSVYSINYLGTLINRLQKNRNIEALIVDDSSMGRKRVVNKLKRTMLTIHEAATAEDALIMLKEQDGIELVMIDYNLPGMNGFELCKMLRDMPNHKELIIIGFSGVGDERLASRFLKSGANDYIPKSCSQEELLCRVMQNLNMQDYIRTYRDASNQDFLTGLHNRRFLMASIPRVQANAKRHKQDYAVAMLDIDHFKQINDSLGHEAGDMVLKSLASELKLRLRESDILARTGGEEFCIVAENCNREQAAILFDDLRSKIEKNIMVSHNDTSIRITVSIGACCDSVLDFDAMMLMADNNLYKAKRNGRNRIKIT